MGENNYCCLFLFDKCWTPFKKCCTAAVLSLSLPEMLLYYRITSIPTKALIMTHSFSRLLCFCTPQPGLCRIQIKTFRVQCSTFLLRYVKQQLRGHRERTRNKNIRNCKRFCPLLSPEHHMHIFYHKSSK